MRKSFLFLAAIALVFVACEPKYDVEDKTVATFEEAAVAPAEPESVLHLAKTGTFESGNFVFTQEVADYGEYGIYYFGNIVSNKTATTYDFYSDSDKSAAGGAHGGKNYVVWTASYTGADGVALKTAAKVPGMFVCNTPWVVDAIKNGDGMSTVAGGFTEDDYFLLTITGSLAGTATGSVEFYLAKGQNIVENWTYVDLSALGKVDEIRFALSSTKTNDYGMTTPAYFAFDDLGGKK